MMDDIFRFLKGFAMGAANVIPGVSGGTIAFITGIFERLIEAIKKFDATTAHLLFRLRGREAWKRVDGRFLGALGVGVAVSIVTMARILEWGFESHPVLVWAFFFGLISASLPAVGMLVKHWGAGSAIAILLGSGIALSMAFLTPVSGSSNMFYLLLCGVVAMCSMIIPGLSGSFVLLLMGTYKLIMIDAVNDLTSGEIGAGLRILVPFGIGALVGLVALARVLSWLFHTWHDNVMALITGFVAGSLAIIWPWKDTLMEEFVRDGEVKEKIIGFENWHLPDLGAGSTWIAFGLMLAGALLIVVLERFVKRPGGGTGRLTVGEETAFKSAQGRDPAARDDPPGEG